MWPVGVGGTRDTLENWGLSQELALPGVYCLLCVVGVVVVWWTHLEVDAVFPEYILEGLGALVVNAEGRGFQAPVEQVLEQPRLRFNQLLGCVVF